MERREEVERSGLARAVVLRNLCRLLLSVHIDNRFRGSSSLLLCNFFFVSDRCSVIYFLMIISYFNFGGAELAMNIIQISK